MAGNTFGTVFRMTTFGESHGAAIGVVVDGCPAGLKLDSDFIQSELDKRKPGTSSVTSPRKEEDRIEIISGLMDGITTGAPVAVLIRNNDARSKDYEPLKDVYRPSHADFVYEKKYGIRDFRGGGRSSARETATRVIAGSIAKQLLKTAGVEVFAFTSSIGPIRWNGEVSPEDLLQRFANEVRCPDAAAATMMKQEIEKAKADGDTLGGIIQCIVKNCPAGLGQPVFDKLQADLAKAMMSIPSVHGFEFGSGFEGSARRGSENNDEFITDAQGNIRTLTNHSGGIQGGISNGMDIYFKVAFKPVSSILKTQQSVNRKGEKVALKITGRHDPCVIPRAVIVVEAMTAVVLADHWLRWRADRI
jgi:chorismate synthase